MISTSACGVSRIRSGTLWWLIACVLAFAALPLLAAESAMPRPSGLERDVQFWIRVYTEIDTNSGFVHDDRNLSVVYETLRFARSTSPRERQRAVDAARDKYVAALRRIAATSGALSAEDQRIRDMWGDEGSPRRLLEATNGIRFQLGQSDRFREGLIRAGAWEAHISQVFANMGLPAELAVLPHVESSFNPAAYSKVGAAGLWQFMRSTGRRYMRIDGAIDDRLDPYRSTEAAAQLLSYNYRLLGTWPLALTAYNHGAAGMRRARESMRTSDIERIVRNYKSPTFGFASRNFYVSFLAALEIDRNPGKYFGKIEPLPEVKFREVLAPAYVPIAALQKALKMEQDTLRALNPALLQSVWSGQRYVPKGYHLRLPDNSEKWTTELLAQRLGPTEQYALQLEERHHRVRSGETLSELAARYGVTTQALADLNGISSRTKLRVGGTLLMPASRGVTVAAVATKAAAPAPAPQAESRGEPASVYVVRRGESIWEISRKVGLSEADLLRINRLKNPNYIYEGQTLQLAAAGGQESVASSGAAPVRGKPTIVASTASRGGVPAEEAQRESQQDEEALAQVGKPAARAEPVSASQAEALGPALGPAIETPGTADPIDYSVGSDNTIVVVAEETLGHYADWLAITAARLRVINKMKYGRPVLIGHKLKLDFSKVSAATFEHTRREYHRTLQAGYFASHRILGTEIYVVRRGDSLWTVTQRYARLPMWLLQQYNPDMDFSEMRAGTQIVVPNVEEVSSADSEAGNGKGAAPSA